MPLKMALFNLQKYVKEGEFAAEFMLKGGLKNLVSLLERISGGMTGNSLAVGTLSHMDQKSGADVLVVCAARCPGYPRI